MSSSVVVMGRWVKFQVGRKKKKVASIPAIRGSLAQRYRWTCVGCVCARACDKRDKEVVDMSSKRPES